MRSISKMVATVAMLGLAACGVADRASVHVVRQHETGGEIALVGAVVESHHAAEDVMLEHCGGRARIVRVAAGGPDATQVASPRVRPETERLHYECVSRAGRLLAGR